MTFETVVEIAGGVLTAAAFAALFRTWFARTLGRRWDRKRRLSKLAPLVQVRYFASILGEPAIKRAAVDFVEYVFVDPLFYVHAIADEEDDAVREYSVTTRSRWFRPKVKWWTGHRYKTIRLGKTSFSAFDEEPTRISPQVGARRFGYAETYYFGNPGMYQTYMLALNDAGPIKFDDLPDFAELFGFDGIAAEEMQGEQAAIFLKSHQGARFRESARPNTYGVVGPMMEHVPTGWPGADLDVVRVLP